MCVTGAHPDTAVSYASVSRTTERPFRPRHVSVRTKESLVILRRSVTRWESRNEGDIPIPYRLTRFHRLAYSGLLLAPDRTGDTPRMSRRRLSWTWRLVVIAASVVTWGCAEDWHRSGLPNHLSSPYAVSAASLRLYEHRNGTDNDIALPRDPRIHRNSLSRESRTTRLVTSDTDTDQAPSYNEPLFPATTRLQSLKDKTATLEEQKKPLALEFEDTEFDDYMDHHEQREFVDPNTGDPSSLRLESPLSYRYYGRNQARTHSAGSIPFILLGPNVDHWKITGQELAARGFSVMACERTKGGSDGGNRESSNSAIDETLDAEIGTNLVLELMDALRWNKAVLVGCDSESVLAIQAAVHLAPERIVGFVLCGNLESAQEFAAQFDDSASRNSKTQALAIDRFLARYLECPYTVVWDGDAPINPANGATPGVGTSSSIMSMMDTATIDPFHGHRSLVIGGGTAPHRRRPKLFAWILTRFVEEKIAPAVSVTQAPRAGGGMIMPPHQTNGHEATETDTPKWHFPLAFRLNEFLTPESRVVVGRMIASVLLYGTAMKVAIVQYENVRDGIFMVSSIRQRAIRIVSSVLGFFVGQGTRRDPSNTVAGHRLVSQAEPSPIFEADQDEVEKKQLETLEEHAKEKEDAFLDEPTADEKAIDGPKKTEQSIPHPSEQFRPIFFLDHVIA